MTKDLIFKCKKCGHEIYTSNARKLFDYDCPECGEEWNENYILIGEGDFKKR